MPPRDTTVAAAAADDRIASLTAGTSDAPRKYTAAQVEKHSTPEDCWLIVHEKVYEYVEEALQVQRRANAVTWALHAPPARSGEGEGAIGGT